MPQKSRSRPGFLGSYDCRRIAARSMWRRSTCARMERTITDFLAKGRSSVTRLLTFGFLSLCRHCQVNTPASSVSPLVQTHDDFFDSPRNGFDIALLVAPNPVTALLDDVAVPACTRRVTGRICRFHRDNRIVFFDQGNNAPPGYRRPQHAGPNESASENGGYGRAWSLSSISGYSSVSLYA
jgi:hypothetical protein